MISHVTKYSCDTGEFVYLGHCTCSCLESTLLATTSSLQSQLNFEWIHSIDLILSLIIYRVSVYFITLAQSCGEELPR